jgi:hypothetical protein
MVRWLHSCACVPSEAVYKHLRDQNLEVRLCLNLFSSLEMNGPSMLCMTLTVWPVAPILVIGGTRHSMSDVFVTFCWIFYRRLCAKLFDKEGLSFNGQSFLDKSTYSGGRLSGTDTRIIMCISRQPDSYRHLSTTRITASCVSEW